MTITYMDSAELITLDDCLRLYNELGVSVVIDEGRHVTLAIEPFTYDSQITEVAE